MNLINIAQVITKRKVVLKESSIYVFVGVNLEGKYEYVISVPNVKLYVILIHNSNLSSFKEKLDFKIIHSASDSESYMRLFGLFTKSFDFCGSIVQQKSSQRLTCAQDFKGFLINKSVKVRLMPILRSSTSDIKANHSVYIGKIPVNNLYYLQTRGIDNKTAQKLLIRNNLKNLFIA